MGPNKELSIKIDTRRPQHMSLLKEFTPLPAQNMEPSWMFEVSRNGLSVPLTSW